MAKFYRLRPYLAIGVALIALLVLTLPVMAQDGEPPDYRQYFGADSRLVIWVVAQLHLLFAAFVLDQRKCAYVPHVVVVPVGSALTVLNSDGILHNIHTTPFDNAPLNKAQPATQKELMSDPFTVPEFIPVGCDVHKWMNATIAVVDNPYAVVTGADGSFTLTDVPAGTYKVEVWHDKLGMQTLTVTVEAGKTAAANAEFK